MVAEMSEAIATAEKDLTILLVIEVFNYKQYERSVLRPVGICTKTCSNI